MDRESPARDRLFEKEKISHDFNFDHKVAEVFDDMLNRSIPFYTAVIEATGSLIRQLVDPGGHVVDLGCSTGSTLLKLSQRLADMNLQFTGIDNAAPMIEKARTKAALYRGAERLTFRREDITGFDLHDIDAIICNYTLQFIRPPLRPGLACRVYESLAPQGIFICAEKVISHDHLLNRTFIDIYHGFKRRQGYSDLEIARKREALENVLVPFSIRENIAMLEDAGFSRVETFFQWFNFAAFVAVKDDAA